MLLISQMCLPDVIEETPVQLEHAHRQVHRVTGDSLTTVLGHVVKAYR